MLMALLLAVGVWINGIHAVSWPTVPTVVVNHPTMHTFALACSSSPYCIPGTATSVLLDGVETAAGDSVSDCAGTCTTYNELAFVQDPCNSTASVATYENSLHEDAFMHEASSHSTRFATSGSSSCSSVSGGSNTTWMVMNFANADAQNGIAHVLTTSVSPASAAILDNHYFDYFSEGLLSGSYEVCDGCGNTWTTGGADNASWLGLVADEVNAVPSFSIILNSLSVPIDETYCDTVSSGACLGDEYDSGMYNSAVRLDGLTMANLYGVREEFLFTDTSFDVATNLGQYAAVLLNTAIAAYNADSNFHLLVQQYPYEASWMESAMTAFQAMVPSSDGTPDVIVQWPYSYCAGSETCGNDTNIWPQQFIMPYGPQFSLTPYGFGGSTAHDATWCPSAGNPAQQGSDSADSGIYPLVWTCVGTSEPLLRAPYAHCYMLAASATAFADLGNCAWVFNTASTTATLPTNSYNYAVTFSGCQYGSASDLTFSWVTGALATALSTAASANTNSTCDNGSLSFGTVPTALAANTATLLVSNIPPGYSAFGTVATTTDSALTNGAFGYPYPDYDKVDVPVSVECVPSTCSSAYPGTSIDNSSYAELWELQPDGWNISTSASGSSTVEYTGSGSIVGTVDFTGLNVADVNGSPLIQYGATVDDATPISGQGLTFPVQLSTLWALNTDVTYDISNTTTPYNQDVIYDEWLTPSATYSSGNAGAVECEIFLYLDSDTGNPLVGTVTVPVTVNGQTTNETFDEYYNGETPGNAPNIVFLPSGWSKNVPIGTTDGEVSMNILPFLDTCANTVSGVGTSWYVAGMLISSEYGTTSDETSVGYTWTVTKLLYQEVFNAP
jgi:Glycosyl hydrolase family 12